MRLHNTGKLKGWKLWPNAGHQVLAKRLDPALADGILYKVIRDTGQRGRSVSPGRGVPASFAPPHGFLFFPECVAKGSRLTLGVWG